MGPVIEEYIGQTFMVGAQLKELTITYIEAFLKKNIDVMAYSADEMSGVNLNTMVHCLSVRAKFQLVKQKQKKKKKEFYTRKVIGN